jgi:hypothetical protein
MFGSGARIAGIVAIKEHLLMVQHGLVGMIMIIVWHAAAPGAAIRGTAVLRLATLTPSVIAATVLVFGLLVIFQGLYSPLRLLPALLFPLRI